MTVSIAARPDRAEGSGHYLVVRYLRTWRRAEAPRTRRVGAHRSRHDRFCPVIRSAAASSRSGRGRQRHIAGRRGLAKPARRSRKASIGCAGDRATPRWLDSSPSTVRTRFDANRRRAADAVLITGEAARIEKTSASRIPAWSHLATLPPATSAGAARTGGSHEGGTRRRRGSSEVGDALAEG